MPADIATVIEGQQYLPGSRQLPYGGQDVTRLLGDMLGKRGVRVPDEGGLTQLKELAARLPITGEEHEVKLHLTIRSLRGRSDSCYRDDSIELYMMAVRQLKGTSQAWSNHIPALFLVVVTT